MPAEIHKYAYNLGFRFTIKDQNNNAVNLSEAVKKDIIFKKPNGTTFTKGGSVVGAVSEGVIQYATASGDLDVAGLWQSQCFIDLGASGSFYSDKIRFKVHDNL